MEMQSPQTIELPRIVLAGAGEPDALLLAADEALGGKGMLTSPLGQRIVVFFVNTEKGLALPLFTSTAAAIAFRDESDQETLGPLDLANSEIHHLLAGSCAEWVSIDPTRRESPLVVRADEAIKAILSLGAGDSFRTVRVTATSNQ